MPRGNASQPITGGWTGQTFLGATFRIVKLTPDRLQEAHWPRGSYRGSVAGAAGAVWGRMAIVDEGGPVKLSYILVGLVVLATMVAAACGEDAGTPTTAPTATALPQPPSTPAAPGEAATPTAGPIAPTSTTAPGFVPTPTEVRRAAILEVRATDAPPPEGVTAIVFTVSRIQVNAATGDEPGWVTVVVEPRTFDLLEIAGIETLLGTANLSPGQYNQVRLDVDSVSVTLEGEEVDARVPSERLRIVGPFLATAGETTILTLDFDAGRSVVVTGRGQVLVRPVAKLLVRKGGQTLADAVEAGAAEPTPEPESTATPAPTSTIVPAPTPTGVPTETPLPPTPTPVPTPTLSPLPTATPVPEPTPTLLPTATPEPTATPRPTRTPRPAATPVPEPTPAPLPTATPEPTTTPRPTAAPRPTRTPRPTATVPPPTPTTAPPPTIRSDISGFELENLTIPAGARVIWTQRDSGTVHTSTSGVPPDPDGIWDTGFLSFGESGDPVPFDTAGSFPYFCLVHTFMTGTVMVTS